MVSFILFAPPLPSLLATCVKTRLALKPVLVFVVPAFDPDPKKSFTNQYQKHKPCGFCYRIKCFDEGVYPSKTVQYRMKNEGENVPQIFVDMLEKEILQNSMTWISLMKITNMHRTSGKLST